MGSGHLRDGFGVPYQLHDLGVDRVVTLLPFAPDEDCLDIHPGVADAVFVLPRKPAPLVLPPRLGVELEEAENGSGTVRVRNVIAGSLAERSGLVAGDRLLEVAGRPAANAAAVLAVVRASPPGRVAAAPPAARRGHPRCRDPLSVGPVKRLWLAVALLLLATGACGAPQQVEFNLAVTLDPGTRRLEGVA